jgi:hypothetical protein
MKGPVPASRKSPGSLKFQPENRLPFAHGLTATIRKLSLKRQIRVFFRFCPISY